jgi:peptide/nickel transport system permease protein
MIALLPRRLAGLAITLVVVSLLIFAVMDMLPGDPASIMLGTSASPGNAGSACRHELGLDQPLPVRYIASGWQASSRGDLGQILHLRRPGRRPDRRAPRRHPAARADRGYALSIAVAIPLGVLAAARKHNGVFDVIASASFR